MGTEAIIYGIIEGATWKTNEYRRLQARNEEVLKNLPESDEWPWLTRGMFALPAPWPQGTYRCQAIHFALTLKDDYGDEMRDLWIGKFEDLLRRLYWFSAIVHFNREIMGCQTYTWKAAPQSSQVLGDDLPEPTTTWQRTLEGS